MQSGSVRKLVQGALMVALAVVLSLFPLFQAPYGGSVTLGSMVPIVLFALLYDFKWSLLTAAAYSLLQMLLGFSAPPAETFWAFSAEVLLDYVLAFSVLSLAGVIGRRFSHRVAGAGVGTVVVMALRFLCHFFSGILIWGVYAPEGQPVWLYSLLYNGSYMLFEMLISTAIVCVLAALLPMEKITGK